MGQTVRVVNPLPITRYLVANDAQRIIVVRRATDLSDGVGVKALNLKRTGAGAIVGTGRRKVFRGHNAYNTVKGLN